MADLRGAVSTGRLAAAAGCSVQQVRDLERLGVIPPATRRENGYRQFGAQHLTALRAYRRLAVAVGPVVARSTMRDVLGLPYGEAVGRVVALHVGLARSRDDALAALRALDGVVEEGVTVDTPEARETMSIGELAAALGVRTSTLRFWEEQRLVTPERTTRHAVRTYPPSAVRDARVVAALRAGGYPIPAVQEVVRSIRTLGRTDHARRALQERLRVVAVRADALLRAGADLADLLGRQRTLVEEPPACDSPAAT